MKERSILFSTPIVRIGRGRMPPLDLVTICDKCNMSPAHGNHQKCSKLRQAEGIAERSGSNS